MYHGDVALGTTIEMPFPTDVGGTMTAPVGLTLAAHVDNGVAEIVAGVSVSVTHDARVGNNRVQVVATAGNGFAAATDVEVFVTAGTLGGVSLIGRVVGTFSIANRSSGGGGGATAADVRIEMDANSTKLATLTHGTYGLAALQVAIDTIDNLLDTEVAAIMTAITNLNNLSALANLYGPSVMEVPDAGTTQYPFTLVVRDAEGALVALDALPVLAITNAAGADRTANASAVTNPSTGVYLFTYGLAAAAPREALRIVATGATGGSARRADMGTAIEDVDTITAISAILSQLATKATSAEVAAGAAAAAEGTTRLYGQIQDHEDNVLAAIDAVTPLQAEQVYTVVRRALGPMATSKQLLAIQSAVRDSETSVVAAVEGITPLQAEQVYTVVRRALSLVATSAQVQAVSADLRAGIRRLVAQVTDSSEVIREDAREGMAQEGEAVRKVDVTRVNGVGIDGKGEPGDFWRAQGQ